MSEDERIIRKRLEIRFAKTFRDRMALSSNLNWFKKIIIKELRDVK